MLWALNDLTIVGSWCYGVNDWPRITAQVSTGRLPVERIITDRLSIDQAASGFERLTAAGADDMKVLVTTSTT
jgi:(R,R)-butanediol dehydrogenase/meso-butanediol dehydrogenase/diacetyl reductase